MKKIYSIIFILFSFSFLFFSCREGSIDPVRLLELSVVDTLGVPVADAKVDFYFDEQDLNRDRNQIIESFYTDKQGIVKVALDIDILEYYVNIEKEQLKNWYTTTLISLPATENTARIVLNEPFEAKLTGKFRKRWQQTDNIINGNPSFANCNNQLYHDFTRRLDTQKDERDGRVEQFRSEICPLPGTSAGINQWIYDNQNNTLIFGVDGFKEIYTIKEITDDKMSLVFRTSNGAITIERRYKFIE